MKIFCIFIELNKLINKSKHCSFFLREATHCGQLRSIRSSALVASMTIAVSSTTGVNAEDLVVDNRREVISSDAEFEVIAVGGIDRNSFLDIVDGGNVNASETVVIGDNFPLDAKDVEGIGTVTISGESSRLTSEGDIIVGGESTGTLVIAEGGAVSAQTIVIGEDSKGLGTLVIGSASGSVAVGAGNIEGVEAGSAEIVFGAGEGSIVINHTEESYEFDATVSGSGRILQEAGYTSLTGDFSEFTGTGRVAGGTLSVDADFRGSVAVVDGGTLTGTGSVGDLIFEAGATYHVKPSIGFLQSTGAVAISDGATLNLVHDDISTTNIWKPIVVLSGESVTGAFDTLKSREDFLFVDLALGYEPDAVIVTAQRNGTGFADLGRSKNQRSTAGAMETLPQGNALYDSFATLRISEAGNIPAILDQLSGEAHATVQGLTLNNSGYVRNTISQRIYDLFGNLEGSVEALVSTHGQAAKPTEFMPGWDFWSQGYGSLAHVDGDSNAGSFETRRGGALAGVDGYLPGSVLAGILAGYEFNATTMDQRQSEAEIESFVIGTYFSRAFGSMQLLAGSVLASNQIGTTREVAFNGFTDSLTADYKSSTFQVFGEAGYAMETVYAQFVPFAGLAFAYLDTDGFEEKGGDAALKVAASSQTLGVSTLGLYTRREFAEPWQGVKGITLDGTVAWRHSFGDILPMVTSSFVGTDTFDIAGTAIVENTLLIQAGATLELNGRLATSVSYNGEFGTGVSQNAVRAGLNLSF